MRIYDIQVLFPGEHYPKEVTPVWVGRCDYKGGLHVGAALLHDGSIVIWSNEKRAYVPADKKDCSNFLQSHGGAEVPKELLPPPPPPPPPVVKPPVPPAAPAKKEKKP